MTVVERMVTRDERDALAAFARTLRREAHVLQHRPDLTWQQLYNRLQWADPPLAARLTVEREQHSRPGSRPWIHLYSRLRESEALVRTLSDSDGLWGCAVSPDGTWIVSAGYGGSLKIWDAVTGAERATFAGHTSQVRSCAVSPDGTWIVSASNDGTLKIWDVATGSERATLTGHDDTCNTTRVAGCAVSPDGTWIVSASNDHTLKTWDAATGAERATLTGHVGSVSGCAVSPDGTWIVSSCSSESVACDDNTLKIWDAATGAERATLAGHTAGVTGCAVSPDGTWIVSASEDSTLRIWDAVTRSERATLTGHASGVRGCAVSPDGAWIASAGFDGTLRIWDAATGAERAVLVLPGGAIAVAFHPAAPTLVCGDTGGAVHFARLVGIDLGPLVVTAAVRDHALMARCSACGEAFTVEKDRLGIVITCPQSACGRSLRINPFVLEPLVSRRSRERGWFRRR
jgi:DNA-binding beta-propeller fold protein YncE